MRTLISLLQWLNGAAFALLGVLGVRGWLRHRDRHWAALAAGVGSLGVMALLGRVATHLDYPRAIAYTTLALFLLSAWGLMAFRHTLIPVKARTRLLVLGAILASGAAVFAMRIPPGPQPRLTSGQLVAVTALILVWAACAGEPAVRFWREARGRMLVQRRRLQALSLGYGGIAAILLVALATHPDADQSGQRLWLQAVGALLPPLLFAALAPPGWLRRRWRAREQGALRKAIEEVVRAPDERLLSARALDWALRLVGADAGVVVWDGSPVAVRGLDPADAFALARSAEQPGVHPVADLDGKYAIACRLQAERRRGALAVMAGPFSPIFGRDELETLEDLGSSIAGAMERLELLHALRGESARYQTLLHAISDLGVGVCIARDGKVAYANEAMLEINGYTRDEMLTMESAFDVIAPEYRPAVADRMVRFFNGEDGGEYWEAPIVRKDGERRELEGAAKVLEINGATHVLSICRDVTERRVASARDRRRAEQLDALARTSQRLAGARPLDELLSGLTSAAREVTRSTRAAVAVELPGAGLLWFDEAGPAQDPAEATGIVDVVVAERRPVRATRSLGRMGETGGVREAMGVPMIRRGQLMGVILVVADGERPFDDIDESVVVSLASYAAEVIEAARAFDRERAMTTRLRELDEIKNSFLAAVSHELRTPLTSVLGFAHTLQRSGEQLGSHERHLLVDRLTVNAEKLERLLADLLDLDRLRRGILEPVTRRTDVGALILRSVESFDFPDMRSIHVDVVPLEAEVDGPKVERIVENLLSNALRHTAADTPVWVRLWRDGDGVLIAVEDAGPGVPADQRAHIFEPFQQGPGVHGHSPGVGIGLSLVARFAEMHGGRAWVTDRAGGGASFRVWLPRGVPIAAAVGV